LRTVRSRPRRSIRFIGLTAAMVLLGSVLAGLISPPAHAGQLSIEVDIAAQHAYVYDGATMIKVIPVSTGAYDRTPRGDFTIYSKSVWASASSEGTVTMHYMSRFLGGYGFHAIPLKNGVPLATPLGERPVSHGCIRMAEEDAHWVFDNLPIGTPVHIHGVFSGTAEPPKSLEPPPPEGGVPVASGDLDGDGKAEMITGAGHFRDSKVRIWKDEGANLLEVNEQQVYGPALPGGVWVAAGDLDGDGKAELITGAGAGGGPHVRIFKLQGSVLVEVAGFYAYDPAFGGGVSVAAGDLDGDGKAELITGAGAGGGPHVRILGLSGTTIVDKGGFFAYDPGFRGGVTVASGNVMTGYAGDEIVTGAGPGGGPHVRVLSLTGGGVVERAGFFAYDPGFRGGVLVGTGNTDGSGGAEVLTGAGAGGGPHVRAVSWTGSAWTELVSFFAYDPAFPGGVFVAGGDVDGDGKAEPITGAGPGGGPDVRIFDADAGAVTRNGVMVEDSTFRGGVEVAGGNLDNAGKGEVVTGLGVGGDPWVRTLELQSGSPTDVASVVAYPPGFGGGVHVATGDVDGDGVPELVTGAGGGGGPHVRVLKRNGSGFDELFGFYAFDAGFRGGVFVAAGDVNGDGKAEIVTAAGPGGGPHVRVWRYSGGVLQLVTETFVYDPGFVGGVHVAMGDLDGDNHADLVTAAGPGGGPHLRVWHVNGAVLDEIAAMFVYTPAFAGGVDVAVGNVDGAGASELITGAGPGGGPHVRVWSLGGGGFTETMGMFAYDAGFSGGVHVACADLAGDGRDEVITGAGPGGRAHVRIWSTSSGLTEIAGFMAVS